MNSDKRKWFGECGGCTLNKNTTGAYNVALGPIQEGTVMNSEWKELPTLQDIAKAQAQGWDIKVRVAPDVEWEVWEGTNWKSRWQFQGRPRLPKMKKVKILGYLTPTGMFMQVTDDYRDTSNWIRQPHLDLEGEVPDDQGTV